MLPRFQYDRHPDAQQKQDGQQERVHKQHHHRAGEQDGDADVNRFFPLTQLLQIRDQSGHARHEALFSGQGADGGDGLHGVVGRGGGVEKDGHQGGVPVVEGVIELLRQHLHRDGDVGQGVVPQHRFDVIHLFDLFLERGDLPRASSLPP